MHCKLAPPWTWRIFFQEVNYEAYMKQHAEQHGQAPEIKKQDFEKIIQEVTQHFKSLNNTGIAVEWKKEPLLIPLLCKHFKLPPSDFQEEGGSKAEEMANTLHKQVVGTAGAAGVGVASGEVVVAGAAVAMLQECTQAATTYVQKHNFSIDDGDKYANWLQEAKGHQHSHTDQVLLTVSTVYKSLLAKEPEIVTFGSRASGCNSLASDLDICLREVGMGKDDVCSMLEAMLATLAAQGATRRKAIKYRHTVSFRLHRVTCNLTAHCDRKSEHAASMITKVCAGLMAALAPQQQQGLKTWIDWAKRHKVAWEATFGAIRGHIKSCHWVMMCSCALSQQAVVYTTATECFAWLMHFFANISFTGLAFDPKNNTIVAGTADLGTIWLVDPVDQKRSLCTIFCCNCLPRVLCLHYQAQERNINATICYTDAMRHCGCYSRQFLPPTTCPPPQLLLIACSGEVQPLVRGQARGGDTCSAAHEGCHAADGDQISCILAEWH